MAACNPQHAKTGTRHIAASLFAFLALALPAFAHDPGLSSAEIRIAGNSIEARVTFSPSDAGFVDPNEMLRLEADGRELTPRQVKTERGAAGELQIRLIYDRVGRQLTVTGLGFDQLPRGHRRYLSVTGIVERVLDAGHPSVAVEFGRQPVTSSFRQFFVLGIEHIFTGYDHLLFLLGLLIVGGSLTGAARIITSFTVAHSITLALATFNVVVLSPRIVEPAIAASIVFVGVENLTRRDLDRRWMLTFAFGLIHGLGFASVLRELGATGVVPLVSFNAGVEAGQMAIACVALPVIWWLRRWPVFVPRVLPACSMVVAAAGTWWFVERIAGR